MPSLTIDLPQTLVSKMKRDMTEDGILNVTIEEALVAFICLRFKDDPDPEVSRMANERIETLTEKLSNYYES